MLQQKREVQRPRRPPAFVLSPHQFPLCRLLRPRIPSHEQLSPQSAHPCQPREAQRSRHLPPISSHVLRQPFRGRSLHRQHRRRQLQRWLPVRLHQHRSTPNLLTRHQSRHSRQRIRMRHRRRHRRSLQPRLRIEQGLQAGHFHRVPVPPASITHPHPSDRASFPIVALLRTDGTPSRAIPRTIHTLSAAHPMVISRRRRSRSTAMHQPIPFSRTQIELPTISLQRHLRLAIRCET